MSEIVATISLSKLLDKPGTTRQLVDAAIAASTELVVSEYVKEAPGNIGDFKAGIESKKIAPLEYVVRSTARDRGENYPMYLYTGTGKLRGAADYGYTSGRVRNNDVAFGIGGIRPNKAAKRAKENVELKFMRKVKLLTSRAIKNK